MPQTTNTYWRIPGETGIPTEFDFAASTGVSGPQVHWPYPRDRPQPRLSRLRLLRAGRAPG